jgi:hypothetical protein
MEDQIFRMRKQKNIVGAKFSSHCMEEPTTGRWRKTIPFFGF